MALKILSNVNQAALFESLADELLQFLSSVEGEQLPVALPGGRSVVGLLSPLLRKLGELDTQNRARLQFFMLDERRVPLDSPDSNFRLLREHVFDGAVANGVLSETQLHPYHYERPVEEYTAELNRYGGKFAAVVLGVGEDAHVGALFPNHHSIRNSEQGFFTMEDSPKPPPLRMTISRALLERSDFGIALFIGDGKKEALQRFLSETPPEECPVSILRSLKTGVLGTDLTI